MLKKKYRLPASVRLGKAKTQSFKHFILKTANSELTYPRFAFVISKKVDNRAVVRNKIKREMTNSIQNMIDKISQGKDMIFILKRSSAENVRELSTDIESAVVKGDLE